MKSTECMRDILSAEGIRSYLSESKKKNRIYVYDCVDSTNRRLKEWAAEGAEDGTVVIADAQTNGRGRLGRSFYSPADSGLYFSMLYRPTLPMTETVKVTVAASVAAARAIDRVIGRYPQIKWVNDLYLDGKKVCGILTEAVGDFQNGMAEAIVIGIGINCYTAFEDDLKEIAGCICGYQKTKDLRNRLAAELIGQLCEIEKSLQDGDYLTEYREHSMVLGRYVVLLQEGDQPYMAEEIRDDGGLVLRDSEGRRRVLCSGEISLRLKSELGIDKPKQA